MGVVEDILDALTVFLRPYGVIPESTFLILGIAVCLSFASNLANRLLVDTKKMASVTKEINAWRRDLERAKKTNDKQLLAKVNKKQPAMMRLQSNMMWDRMKVSFLFFAPFLLIFTILNRFYGGLVDPYVALSPFQVPFLLVGKRLEPGGYGLLFFAWYIICSFAAGLPLSRIMGVNPEET